MTISKKVISVVFLLLILVVLAIAFLRPFWQNDHSGVANLTPADLSRLEKFSEAEAAVLFFENQVSDRDFLHVLGYFKLADLEKKRLLITVTAQCFASGDEILLKEKDDPFLFGELGRFFPSEVQESVVELGVIDTLLLLGRLTE